MPRFVRRLGQRRWDALPWDDGALTLAQDETDWQIESTYLIEKARTELDQLDVFAVFVLFSVFEARVRGRVLDEIDPVTAAWSHPAWRKAARDLSTTIKEGSFV